MMVKAYKLTRNMVIVVNDEIHTVRANVMGESQCDIVTIEGTCLTMGLTDLVAVYNSMDTLRVDGM